MKCPPPHPMPVKIVRCKDVHGKFMKCGTARRASLLSGGYLARGLTFTFVGQKLAAISFTSSIDGFSYATAALKHQCGEPTRIVHDDLKTVDGVSLPHVEMTWRNGRSTVKLDDPLPHSLVLSVHLQLDAAAKALTGSAT